MAVTVDVYGSCVSRDLFYYTGAGKYELRRCIVHTPVSSLYEKPIHLDAQALEKSGFKKSERVLLQIQSERIAPGMLKRNKSDYLIMDLADELMNLREITIKSDSKENAQATTYLTQLEGHTEEYDRLFESDEKYDLGRTISPLETDISVLERKFRKFSREILFSENNRNGYKADQIIIIEAYYAAKYVDKDANFHNQDISYRVKESNAFLGKLYKILEGYLPGCRVIKFPLYTNGFEGHRNGVHPLNYMSDIYYYFERVLDVMVNYSKTNTPQNLWLEQSCSNKLYERTVYAAVISLYKTQIAELQRQMKWAAGKIVEIDKKQS